MLITTLFQDLRSGLRAPEPEAGLAPRVVLWSCGTGSGGSLTEKWQVIVLTSNESPQKQKKNNDE